MTTLSPINAPVTQGNEIPRKRLYGILAEFHDPAALMAAADKVRMAGFRWWDCHTPFPVHGLDKAMGIKRTILPVLVFGAGMTGTMIGFLFASLHQCRKFLNLGAGVGHWISILNQRKAAD